MAGITVKSANGKAESEELSNSKDFKKAKPVTGQPVGSNRRALDSFVLGVYSVGTDLVAEAGSDDNVVVLTGHPAKVGDVLRIQNSANSINEFEIHIDEIVDANSFKLSCILSAPLEAGDTFTLLRPVSQRFTEDGASLTTIEAAPVTFELNGTVVTVVEDTAVPGNNTPLPVKVTSATGDINITAGDLNVQLSDQGINADVTRIGDGTTQLGITVSNEAKVNDASAIAQLVLSVAELVKITQNTADLEALLTTLNGTDFATDANLDAIETLLTSLDGKDYATQTTLAAILSDLQAKADAGETQPVSVASLPLPTGASTSSKQDDIITAIGNIAAGGDATAANQLLGNASVDSIDTNIGAIDDASVSNPVSDASVIAALKGLMTLIISTNTKLDALETAATPELDSTETAVVTDSGVTTFTAPVGARLMQISNNAADTANPIRWTPAAETPSSSNGSILIPTAPGLLIPAGSIKAIALGGNADITVTWYV